MNVTSQAIGSRQASVGMTPPTDDVMALGGVAASVHPFVTETALDVIRQGGNAVDAAVAAAAVLTVVEPRNGHLGGDTFMLINLPGENRVVALNGSGAAPAAASLEQYVARGGIPKDGLWAASVPGTVHCWGTAVERYGSMPLAGLLAPAIGYARAGVPVSRRLRRMLANEAERFRRFPASARIFVPDGRVPEVGEIFRQPELARSLERIARDGWQDFYSGALARELVQASDELDGLFSLDDFATHDTLERAPLSSDYRGYTVFEQPPVSQGIIVLLALNILRQFDLPSLGPATAATIHLQIEALKLAFEDALCHLGDPDHVELPLEALLSDEHARKQAARIRPEAAMPFPWPGNIQPDTTYMCAADGQGTVVSYIHSLFAGCAVVLGDTGALMNNRMLGFNLTPGHPNCLAPGKRPIHTLNSYLVQRDGE
ncbi:MAG TPA: gamma-glutamyltransferase, partial [Nitrolancea sp.]|nr:gamma-glutamyltransferase [Nitrolancea sp.]